MPDQPITAATSLRRQYEVARRRPLLTWLNQRLMERGNRAARRVVEVTVVYERHDGSMTSVVLDGD